MIMTAHTTGFAKSVIFIFIVFCSSAFAQSNAVSTPEERAQRWDTWMKENLAITPEQEDPIHTINLKYAQQNEHLKTSGESRRAKFHELKSSDKQKTTELKAILTKEQFDLYLAKKKEFQKQLLERRRS